LRRPESRISSFVFLPKRRFFAAEKSWFVLTAGLYHNQKIVVKSFSFTFFLYFGAACRLSREPASSATPTKSVQVMSLHGTPNCCIAAVCRVKLFQRSERIH